MNKEILLAVNGNHYRVDPQTHSSLLAYLRNELGLTGTKTGCETGNCGACTVLVNDVAVQSCQMSLKAAAEAEVQTIESLKQTLLGSQIINSLSRYDAAQCGYCLPGIVVAAYYELLNVENPNPVHALQRNLCRCGTHSRIITALQSVIKDQDAST